MLIGGTANVLPPNCLASWTLAHIGWFYEFVHYIWGRTIYGGFAERDFHQQPTLSSAHNKNRNSLIKPAPVAQDTNVSDDESRDLRTQQGLDSRGQKWLWAWIMRTCQSPRQLLQVRSCVAQTLVHYLNEVTRWVDSCCYWCWCLLCHRCVLFSWWYW